MNSYVILRQMTRYTSLSISRTPLHVLVRTKYSRRSLLCTMQKEGKGDCLSASLGRLSVRPSASASPRTSSLTPFLVSGSGSNDGLAGLAQERPPTGRQQLPPPPAVMSESNVASRQFPVDSSHPLANAEWTFVKEPKEMFECGVCLGVLSEPHLPLCCSQNHICLKCIEKWRARGEGGIMEANCPFCKTPKFQTRLDVDLKNQILDLEVRCLYHEDGCQWTGKLRDAELHVTNNCNFLPVRCPNGCGTAGLQRQQLKHHMMTQCGHTVVQCPFRSVGCPDLVQRQNVPTHVQQGIHRHLKEVSVKTAAVSASCSARLEELRAKYESQHEAKESELASLREKIAQVQLTVVSLEKELRDGREKVDALREDQERNTAHCLTELREKGEQIVRLRNTYPALNAQIQALPATRVATPFIVPPALFKIDNFSELRTNDTDWCSPPFYSHHAGYKMYLAVYPNGYGESKGVNMSVFVHFMEGEYDDYLQWPFEGLITIVVFNQQRWVRKVVANATSANYRRKIFLDKERSFGSRLRVGANECHNSGWGYHDFIPLKDLGKYLTLGDSLEIKVLRITFLPL